jgi:hypothetical protein
MPLEMGLTRDDSFKSATYQPIRIPLPRLEHKDATFRLEMVRDGKLAEVYMDGHSDTSRKS